MALLTLAALCLVPLLAPYASAQTPLPAASGSGACPARVVPPGANATVRLYPAPFKGVREYFGGCRGLPSGGVFFWNFTALAGNKSAAVTTLFVNAPQSTYGWSAWGFSPNKQMLGSSVVVGYGNPTATAEANVESYLLPSYSPASFVETDTAWNNTAPPAVQVAAGGARILLQNKFTLVDPYKYVPTQGPQGAQGPRGPLRTMPDENRMRNLEV